MFQSLSLSRKSITWLMSPSRARRVAAASTAITSPGSIVTSSWKHCVLLIQSFYPSLCSNHSSLGEPPGRDFPVLCSGHPGWCRDHLEKTKSNEIQNNSGEFGGYWLWIPIVMEIESLHPSDQRPLNMLQTHITVHNSLHWFTLRSRQTGWGRVCVNAKT